VVTKNDSNSSSIRGSRLESFNNIEVGNHSNGSSYGSRKATNTTINSKPLLSSSQFLGNLSPPKPNNEEVALSLKVR